MRLTQKKLDAYMRSERAGFDGIGYNDTWNLANFGITQAEAGIIARAMSEEYGLCTPSKPSLTALKRRMELGL